MVFRETSVFTRQISKLIPDEAYREFQQELIFNPTAGDLIKGSGGLRKIRWRSATGNRSRGTAWLECGELTEMGDSGCGVGWLTVRPA